MSKIAVVYWSGSGNTEAMANAVLDGIKAAGGDGALYTPDDFNAGMMDEFDAVAFGCPSMGDEELEDTVFLPMFEPCRAKISGKKIALFGSYGWGDGEWMRNWEKFCRDDGAIIACDSVTCCDAPDDAGTASCKALGAALI